MDPLKQEFIELFEASGWSQAEVARQLDLTRSGVNQIVTGTAKPSQTLVRLFRLVLAKSGIDTESKVKYPEHQPNHDTMNDNATEIDDLVASIKAQPKSKQPELIETLKRVVKLAGKA